MWIRTHIHVHCLYQNLQDDHNNSDKTIDFSHGKSASYASFEPLICCQWTFKAVFGSGYDEGKGK